MNLRRFLISLSALALFPLVACGDDDGGGETDTSVDNDTALPDDTNVADTDSGFDGSVSGMWVIREVQTVLATLPTGGQTEQESVSVYLADHGTDGSTVSVEICAWRTEGAGVTTIMPSEVFDVLGVWTRDASVTAEDSGHTYHVARGYQLRGVTLDDPAADAMPLSGDDAAVIDIDDDGNPGMTLVIQGIVSGELYVGQRHHAELTGTFVSPTRVEGLTDFATDQVIYGGSPESVANFDPMPVTHPDASKSTFVMVATPELTDCDGVRAALDDLF